jgi:outer membrane lipoprotein LolB
MPAQTLYRPCPRARAADAGKRRARLLLLLVLASILAGCGGGIRPGVDDQRHWQLRGKIGLRGPQLAESAYLNWRQCGPNYDLRLSGPLGQSVARIEGRDSQLTVAIAGREPVTTAEPEQLLQQQLGWSVPIRALRYWVRAEAAPGGGAELLGPPQQPQHLRQFGWQVDYLSYYTSATVALPAKLILHGGNNVRATLLISDWLLSDAVEDCPAPH